MSRSTFAFHDTDAPFGDDKFGVVVYGWAFAKSVPPANRGELEKISKQCQFNKERAPSTRCLTYLNLELSLGWYSAQREVQDNATLAHLMLLKSANGSIIYDSPSPDMKQAFWDFRVPAVIEYWKDRILSQVITSANLDGVLFDDCAGFPNEHADTAKDFCGQSFNPATKSCSAVADVKSATFAALANFTHYLAANRRYSMVYEGMDPTDVNLSRFVFLLAPSNDSKCSDDVRSALALGSLQKPFVMTVTSFTPTYYSNVSDPHFKMHLAAFLIARGRHAYFGTSDLYDGSHTPNLAYTQLALDYGVPLEDGIEIESGLFKREWSKYTISLDCNTYKGSILPRVPFHPQLVV